MHTKPGLRASDVMTREPISLREETSVLDAAKLFVSKRISGAPVVDGHGKLTGVLSEEDLIAALYEDLKDLAQPIGHCHVLGASLITRKVVSVKLDTPLVEIAKIMMMRKFKRVPVAAPDGHLVGIVSRKDILRALIGLEGR